MNDHTTELRNELEKAVASLVEAFGEDYYPVVRARAVLNRTSQGGGVGTSIPELERIIRDEPWEGDDWQDQALQCAKAVYALLQSRAATTSRPEARVDIDALAEVIRKAAVDFTLESKMTKWHFQATAVLNYLAHLQQAPQRIDAERYKRQRDEAVRLLRVEHTDLSWKDESESWGLKDEDEMWTRHRKSNPNCHVCSFLAFIEQGDGYNDLPCVGKVSHDPPH